MFQVEEKIWFWTLLVIPVLVVFFLLLQFWKKRTQKKFANSNLLKRLSPNQSLFKSVLKLIVLCLAFASLTIALVNPKVGTALETVKREGVDIVFAVDVSKSMLAEDIKPNRLEKAQQLVSKIIDKLGSDRVGIIAYAGKAFPQLPITTDYSAAKMFLQNLNTDMLSSQGTAINEAINLAKTYYDDDQQTNRVLVIISDGEDHSETAVQVAEEASKEGIKIFTIGVGQVTGGPIPIKRNGVLLNYKKDKQGETVITRLDEETLKEIASQANGVY
ncbi:MAG: VWA domain-containing protein, partial [Olleya sp.]